MGWNPKADLHLLKRFLIAQSDARYNLRHRLMKPVLQRLHAFEVLRYQFHKAAVIQVPGGRDDEISGREAFLIELQNCGLLKFSNGFLGAQDRFTQRVILPEILGENLVYEVFRAVLVHFDFFQNRSEERRVGKEWRVLGY